MNCNSIYIPYIDEMDPQHSRRSHFGIMFSLVARRWRRSIETHLSAAGLTDATWVPLVHLKATGGGVTQKQLAALVGVEGSSLVRVLDILAREGLIERRRDKTDGRAKLIHLTPEGEERVVKIRRELARAEEAILSQLSDHEIESMLGYFQIIDQRMSELDLAARKEKLS